MAKLMQTVIGRMLVTLLIFSAVTGTAAAKPASHEWPLEWHWLRVMPDDQKDWVVDHGVAQVTIRSHNLEAVMKNGDVILKGEIKGTHVRAVETLVGTDATPMIFHGDMEAIRTRLTDPSNGWGSDRISLSAPGGFYIGLFRSVRSGAPPANKPQEP